MPKRKRNMKAVALYKRTRRRILTKRPFVSKRSTKASISRGQKRALEKLINEDVYVKDVNKPMAYLTTQFAAQYPAGTNAGAFFRCPGNQVVVGSAARS